MGGFVKVALSELQSLGHVSTAERTANICSSFASDTVTSSLHSESFLVCSQPNLTTLPEEERGGNCQQVLRKTGCLRTPCSGCARLRLPLFDTQPQQAIKIPIPERRQNPRSTSLHPSMTQFRPPNHHTNETCRDLLDTYDAYPLCSRREDLDSHDLTTYHSELESRAPELFVASELSCNIELREYVKTVQNFPHDQASISPGQGNGVESHESYDGGALLGPRTIATSESLRAALDKRLPPESTRIITIYRANSWSRMKITLDMFRMLCVSSRVTPRYLDLIRGMGYKSGPADEHFMSCYCYIHAKSGREENDRTMPIQGKDFTSDICYNLRYFEKHGRDLQDPWSCRQSVVHQKYAFGDATSELIVIQPSKRWKTGLDDVNFNKITHPLALHLRFISPAMANSWEYLEYMSNELLSLDQRITFPKPLEEFDFDFTLSQHVQALRKKLHHIRMILDGMLRIVTAISSHAETIQDLGKIPISVHRMFLGELGNVSRDLLTYKSTTNELLNLSADIKSTINSVLEFRSQDLLYNNGRQLHRIAEANSKETQVMSEVAQCTYNDSRTMRIATVIALVYLPANLVLTFFSTVFVEFNSKTNATGIDSTATAESDGLLIHTQIWVAVVSIVALVLGTGSWFWLWDRRKGTVWPTVSTQRAIDPYLLRTL